MGLLNGTILVGASVSATGGTSKTLSPDGVAVANGVHLVDASNSDITSRMSVTAKAQAAQFQNGKWSKGKRSMTLTIPVVKSLEQHFPSVFITISDHPTLTQTEVTALLTASAQLLTDPDYANFWLVGSLA